MAISKIATQSVSSSCSTQDEEDYVCFEGREHERCVTKNSFQRLFPEYVQARARHLGPSDGIIYNSGLSRQAICVLRDLGRGSIASDTSLLPLMEVEALRKRLCGSEDLFRPCYEHIPRACQITLGWNPQRRWSPSKQQVCDEERVALFSPEKWFLLGPICIVINRLLERKGEFVPWKANRAGKLSQHVPNEREGELIFVLLEKQGNFLDGVVSFLSDSVVKKTNDYQTFHLDFRIFEWLVLTDSFAGENFREMSLVCPCVIVLYQSDLREFWNFEKKHRRQVGAFCCRLEYRGPGAGEDVIPVRIPGTTFSQVTESLKGYLASVDGSAEKPSLDNCATC